MKVSTTSLLLAIIGLALGHAHGHGHHTHHARRLARRAERQEELHSLFRRQSSNYPTADVPGPRPLPAWTAAYTKAKAAGLIPSIPPSVVVNGVQGYPRGTNGNDMTTVCSWTMNNCNATTDIVNAPPGMIGISFDDGPQPDGLPLYHFLQQNQIPSTHFMIGSRILDNPSIFKSALSIGGDIAVHTWSHPLMTTMTDAQVLGELGWCMQIIYDNSGGLIPPIWRPPYGDVDNRVRAIAQQVFGLSTVIWNQDTDDWCLNDDGTNACPGNAAAPTNSQALAAELTKFISGPKSPGLIILEHEHKSRAVQGFMQTAWPLIQSQGWNYQNIPQLFNWQWYQNSADDNSTVQSAAIAVNPVSTPVPLRGAALSAAISADTLTKAVASGSAVGRSVPSVSAASQSGINLAAAVPDNQASSAPSKMTTGAKIGIIAGSAAGVLILSALGGYFFLCRRRRRGVKQAGAGLNAPHHPYMDMMMIDDEKPSHDMTFDEKEELSSSHLTPHLLYAPTAPAAAHDAARRSAVSMYSQHDAMTAVGDSYFDGPAMFGRSASQRTDGRPATRSFHLPTSAVRKSSVAAPIDRPGWL